MGLPANSKTAVLMTCFNRCEKTVRCLKSLKEQRLKTELDLYVCDDNSTDGTRAGILAVWPDAVIIPGTGRLFWSRGMYRAMCAAAAHRYRYYLMVNDDVVFFPNMLEVMFEAFRDSDTLGVVGCTMSETTGRITYGGARMIRTVTNYLIGERIGPNGTRFEKVDLANWNCFLIDDNVIQKVGMIDNHYEHSLGDYDYSLRMRRSNIPIVVAKQFIGHCENNTRANTYRDSRLSRLERLRKLFQPNGLPVKSWFRFVNRYYGICKYRNFICPYVKFFWAILCKKDIK